MTSAELAVVAPTPAGRRATLPEKLHYAETLSRAGLLPDAFRRQPANVLWAMEYAEALRLPTIAAITGVHVMDGKPTPSAALMSALVRRAGHRLRIGYDPDRRHGIRGMAWAEITRADDPEFTFRAEWTIERAVEAELCQIRDGVPYARTKSGKTGTWQKFGRAMMKARALSECARDACEEALLGMHYTAEELAPELLDDAAPAAGPAEPPPVDDGTDWDALIAEAETKRDRLALVGLWKRARADRPGDTELHDRIAAAGDRVKAATEQPQQPGPDEPLDAEVVDPPPDDADVREREMFALLGKTGVGNDRAARLQLLGLIVGQEITTSADLTYAQRLQVIERLRGYERDGDIADALTRAQEDAALADYETSQTATTTEENT